MYYLNRGVDLKISRQIVKKNIHSKYTYIHFFKQKYLQYLKAYNSSGVHMYNTVGFVIETFRTAMTLCCMVVGRCSSPPLLATNLRYLHCLKYTHTYTIKNLKHNKVKGEIKMDFILTLEVTESNTYTYSLGVKIEYIRI